MPYKVGVLTTIGRNIGDDLIRDGILRTLEYVLRGKEVLYVLIDKHRPLTAYPPYHPARIGDCFENIPRGKGVIRKFFDHAFWRLGGSKFDDCDLLVQSGAPVFWEGCGRCEWGTPIWRHIFGRLSSRVDVLNLAAGSCYPWTRRPDQIVNPVDRRFATEILEMTKLTTARDELAKKLCRDLGFEVSLLPCTAFIAASGPVAPPKDDDYIILSLMRNGGHYIFEQDIDVSVWRSNGKKLANRLKKRHKIAFLCHDASEYRFARELSDDDPIFFPRTSSELLEVVQQSKGGICNRMHASVALASCGRPALSICTDTRMLMPALLGLPIFYVAEVQIDRLEDCLENELARGNDRTQELYEMREHTRNRYEDLISEVIS